MRTWLHIPLLTLGASRLRDADSQVNPPSQLHCNCHWSPSPESHSNSREVACVPTTLNGKAAPLKAPSRRKASVICFRFWGFKAMIVPVSSILI